jgi:arabinofuranosyltransferase
VSGDLDSAAALPTPSDHPLSQGVRMLGWLAASVLCLLFGLHIAGAWHDRDTACDDAYITFRFAANVADGHGLRWNPDSAPCEGYSNLTYVLAIAGLSKLGIDPVDGALTLATLSLLALLALLLRAFAKGSMRGGALALLPACLLFANDDLRIHASRGLETITFATLACFQVATAARLGASRPDRRRDAVLAGATGTLLFLTRPDGVLVSAACWAGLWWTNRHDDARRRNVHTAALLWLASGALYAAWKLWYFGYLLPNPFYMKAGATGWAGLGSTLAFLREHAPLFVVSTIAFAAGRVMRRRTGDAGAGWDRSPWLVTLIVVPWLAYGAKIVHEIGFNHRFCWPLLPLLALAAGRALANVARQLPTRWRLWTELATLTATLAWIAPTQLAVVRHLEAPPPVDSVTSMFLRLGRGIGAFGQAEKIHLYCSHAGATPYASKAHHIDPAGLVDDGYCRRTPPEERAKYEASLRLDVIAWHLFPASQGAATFPDDPRAMASRYLNEWVLGLDPDLDQALRVDQAKLDVEQRRAANFPYMTILRDQATLVGEMQTGARRWRSFVYVWKHSSQHDALLAHLRRHVDIPAEAIDYVDWPR